MRWALRLGRVPLGVLVLGAVLAFLGAGLLVAGVYLAVARADVGRLAAAATIIVGPLAVYVALSLVRLARWAWLAIILLLTLLLGSSVVRLVYSPGLPMESIGEIALEIVSLLYLGRRRVRGAFDRP